MLRSIAMSLFWAVPVWRGRALSGDPREAAVTGHVATAHTSTHCATDAGVSASDHSASMSFMLAKKFVRSDVDSSGVSVVAVLRTSISSAGISSR